MRKNLDYDLLIKAERIRFHHDYSSSHWLFQVICIYEQGIKNKLKRDAWESVIRTAINAGCKKAIELSKTYPDAAGFPDYLNLTEDPEAWQAVCYTILNNFEQHKLNRFPYLRDGD
jgi:hypothetical protein